MRLLALLLALPAAATAETFADYSETQGEFGEGTVRAVTMATTDTEHGGLNMVCVGGKMGAQIVSGRTMFPGDADLAGGTMTIPVTMKVDTASEARSGQWLMRVGDYETAMFQGYAPDLLEEMLQGARLSVRLDRQGTIWRFDLEQARPHLQRLRRACVDQDAAE